MAVNRDWGQRLPADLTGLRERLEVFLRAVAAVEGQTLAP
jgi:hypothetical protein